MPSGGTLIVAATADELATSGRDWESSGVAVAARELRAAGDDYGLVIGVGPADAAMRTAAALGRVDVDAVLGLGLAGALPTGDLAVGDAVVGTDAVFGDLGRAEPDGFTVLDEMGIDGDATAGPFPLAEVDAAGDRGRIASVASVSATDERAERLADRTGAVAETMETAAVARVGAVYGVPVAAVAGVSNRAAADRGFDAGAGLAALRDALDGRSGEVAP